MQSIDKPKKCLYATRGERVSSVDRVFQQGKSNSELFVLSCNSLSFLSSKIDDITNKRRTATMWRRKKRIRGKRKKFEWIIPIISEEWLEFRESSFLASSRANLPSPQIFETSTRSKHLYGYCNIAQRNVNEEEHVHFPITNICQIIQIYICCSIFFVPRRTGQNAA